MNEDALRRGGDEAEAPLEAINDVFTWPAPQGPRADTKDVHSIASWEPQESGTTAVFTAGTVPEAHVTSVEQKKK